MHNFKSAASQIFKAMLVALVSIFICVQGYSQVYPVDTIMRNGERSNRINLAYLSDGYQSAELPAFVTNATTINNALFSETPFAEYKKFFNAYAIEAPSVASGAIHPGTASDEASSGGQPVANPNNIYQSTFDYYSIHRLLVPQNYAGIYGTLASNLPDYSQPIVVVNSPYYGGSGGSFATGSIHSSSAEIAIHEIGHSLAGLADEYYAGDGFAAEKPNMTADNNPATVKWKNWMGFNGIDIYLNGTTAGGINWYRPHQNCKMRALNNPFCSVCRERFIDVFHQQVSMIDAIVPAATSFILTDTSNVNFSITVVQTSPSSISINWYLNGSATPFATNVSAVTVPFFSLAISTNTVRAEVIDNTSLSKSYLPGVGYINNVTWSIDKPVTLPVKLLAFAGKANHDAGLISWEIDAPADLKGLDLEKSKDGVNFSKLITVAPRAGQKKYDYTDEQLFKPATYYRLRIQTKDGASFYSSIIKLQNAFGSYFYKVYQNAAQHRYHLLAGELVNDQVLMQVTDAAGRNILNKNFGVTNGQLDYNIDLSAQPAGVYLLNIRVGNSNYSAQLIAQ